MVMTRMGKGTSQSTTTSNPIKYVRHSNAEDVLDELLEDMSQLNKDPEILVPLSKKIRQYENRLSGNSFVLAGPANSGKESHVLWLAKDLGEGKEEMETHLITIDCRIYESDSQFLTCLTRELRCYFGQSVLAKHIVINQTNINLFGLNKQFQRLKRKQLIIVIRSTQILASQRRKQRILYNIFEWLNNTDVKKYITIIMLTRNITFIDKLEKRTKSRMNLPIIYLHKIKPNQVLEVIKKRLDYRIQNTTKKNAVFIQKLKNAFDGNKELMRILEQQYEFCPRDITHYLKIFKLIITLDIQNLKTLESTTQQQLNTIIAEGFSHYSSFSAQYKTMAKYLFINLSLPQIILLGFIRQRLMNQQGRNNTQLSLKILQQDYNMIRQRRNIFQGGTTCNYNQTVLEEALLRLQDENFITIAKIQNIQLFERAIVSQYSPDDLLNYFKQYCQREDGVPSLVMEVYHSAIFHPE